MANVEKFIRVLHRLVDCVHSLVVIERDLDVIAEPHWVLGLCPESGASRAVAGPPEAVVAAGSHTRVSLGLALAPAQAGTPGATG